MLIDIINAKSNKDLKKLSTSVSQEGRGDIFVSLQKLQKRLVSSNKIANESVFIDFIRDLAVLYEEQGDIDTAYALMLEAKRLRPNGGFIANKTLQYHNKIHKNDF